VGSQPELCNQLEVSAGLQELPPPFQGEGRGGDGIGVHAFSTGSHSAAGAASLTPSPSPAGRGGGLSPEGEGSRLEHVYRVDIDRHADGGGVGVAGTEVEQEAVQFGAVPPFEKDLPTEAPPDLAKGSGNGAEDFDP
jgi:hypothetical protein